MVIIFIRLMGSLWFSPISLLLKDRYKKSDNVIQNSVDVITFKQKRALILSSVRSTIKLFHRHKYLKMDILMKQEQVPRPHLTCASMILP